MACPKDADTGCPISILKKGMVKRMTRLYVVMSMNKDDYVLWGEANGSQFTPFFNPNPTEINEQFNVINQRNPVGITLCSVVAGRPYIVPFESNELEQIQVKLRGSNANTYGVIFAGVEFAERAWKNKCEIKLR